jgi:hypothetical protein
MSNFKVSDDKEKLGSLASHQRQRILLDNDAFINKGNKQAAKRASSKQAGKQPNNTERNR